MASRILPDLLDLVNIRVEREGGPRVHDDGGVRCLRFSEGVVQSAMRVAEPFTLDLSYTRAMMGFLLVNPDPRDILIVGLGGGSLPKFCWRELPRARVTTVEIDPEVIALRDAFRIPADDERFRIVQADACDFLARDDLEADVILLDGYDAAGLPERLCSEAFYADCRRALRAQGVLVTNLWGGEPDRALYLERLRALFDGRVWWSRPRESSSLIVYAAKGERFTPQWSRLMAQARVLDTRHRLDLVRVVNDMRERPDPDG